MPRLLGATIVAVALLIPALASAQGTPGRSNRPAVVLDQARGDGVIITTVPAGVLVQLLRQQGDWYQISLVTNGRPIGWVHRDSIDLEPGSAASPVTAAPRRSSFDTSVPIRAPQAAAIETDRPAFGQGTTEVMFTGQIASYHFGDETTTISQLSGLLGYAITNHLEIVGQASVLKASDVDASGDVHGGLFVNVPRRTIVPFAGGMFGRTIGVSSASLGFADNANVMTATAGFRVMTEGGGGALVVAPFYQRHFLTSDFGELDDLNSFGVSLGVSLIFR